MSFLVLIPGPLREMAANRAEVRVKGSAETMGRVLALLWAEVPGVRDRVVTELGEVRPHVNIFIDGESIKFTGGLASPVRDGAEIVILPALSGG